MQEVLARAQVRWRRIGDVDNPEVYVRRMVVNEYLSWRRSWASRHLHFVGERLVDLDEARGGVGDHAQRVVDADDLEPPRRTRPQAAGGPGAALLRGADRRGDRRVARLLAGHRPQPGIEGLEEAPAHVGATYDYEDAVRLALLWKMNRNDFGAVKAEAGRRLLAGKKLPIQP